MNKLFDLVFQKGWITFRNYLNVLHDTVLALLMYSMIESVCTLHRRHQKMKQIEVSDTSIPEVFAFHSHVIYRTREYLLRGSNSIWYKIAKSWSASYPACLHIIIKIKAWLLSIWNDSLLVECTPVSISIGGGLKVPENYQIHAFSFISNTKLGFGLWVHFSKRL